LPAVLTKAQSLPYIDGQRKRKTAFHEITQLRKRELSLKLRAKYFSVENGYLQKEISYNVQQLVNS